MIKIDEKLIESLVKSARHSKRKRLHYSFHKYGDKVQRLLNAVEPQSYIRPHKHLHTQETFLILRGKVAVLLFNNDGSVSTKVILNPETLCGIEIPPNTIHSLVSLEKGSVLYLIMEGPYEPSIHKEYPHWSPEENSTDAKRFMLQMVKEAVSE